jgi:hypothetical protein
VQVDILCCFGLAPIELFLSFEFSLAYPIFAFAKGNLPAIECIVGLQQRIKLVLWSHIPSKV